MKKTSKRRLPIRIRGLRKCRYVSIRSTLNITDDRNYHIICTIRSRWNILSKGNHMSDLEEAAKWYCDHEITATEYEDEQMA